MASGARPCDGPPGEVHLAVPAHQPADGVEQGGLPRAVGPDEGDDLALPDVAGHAAEGGDGAVVGVEVADF